MPDPDTDEILWYNPDPRTVIPLDGFHKSRSLTRTVKKRVFEITFDQDFSGVIQGCASRQPTWISDEIKAAYVDLFKLGFCHSVEVRGEGGSLVGGLYGISQGGVFNAESMFSREKDASKVALWALTERAPAAWLWWALLPCTCILGLFTLLFAASPDGIPFVIYGDSFRPTSRK
jgi:leucyl/phenylalanyl-tRNA--protein transferase